MNAVYRWLAVLAAGCAQALAAPAVAPALTGFPFTNETLNYTINWPSGLSLGEAHLMSRKTSSGWAFELAVSGGVPGFEVKDSYLGNATPEFCSTELSRDSLHGSHRVTEKETITSGGEVTRTTLNGGGKSTFSAPSCVRDALTLLFFARRELGQGRVPLTQQTVFGPLLQTRMVYTGPQVIQVGERPVESDRVVCTVKSAGSSIDFEMYFARDPARTPLLVKVPLGMGKFSMELVR